VRPDLEVLSPRPPSAGYYTSHHLGLFVRSRALERLAATALDMSVGFPAATALIADRIAVLCPEVHEKKLSFARDFALPVFSDGEFRVHRPDRPHLDAIIVWQWQLGARSDRRAPMVHYYGWALKNRAALNASRDQLKVMIRRRSAARERLKAFSPSFLVPKKLLRQAPQRPAWAAGHASDFHRPASPPLFRSGIDHSHWPSTNVREKPLANLAERSRIQAFGAPIGMPRALPLRAIARDDCGGCRC